MGLWQWTSGLAVLAELSVPSLLFFCLELADATEAALVHPLAVMLLLDVLLVLLPRADWHAASIALISMEGTLLLTVFLQKIIAFPAFATS